MVERLTPEQIAEIEARANAATPGPWFHWLATTEFVGWTVQIAAGWLFKQSDKAGNHDAEFIAHAREDIPALLATLRTVEQERDAWHRRWLDETATSEQFERERDDARAALRLMQEANKS